MHSGLTTRCMKSHFSQLSVVSLSLYSLNSAVPGMGVKMETPV